MDLEQTTQKSDVGTVPSLSSKLKNEKNLAFAQFIKKHVQKGLIGHPIAHAYLDIVTLENCVNGTSAVNGLNKL